MSTKPTTSQDRLLPLRLTRLTFGSEGGPRAKAVAEPKPYNRADRTDPSSQAPFSLGFPLVGPARHSLAFARQRSHQRTRTSSTTTTRINRRTTNINNKVAYRNAPTVYGSVYIDTVVHRAERRARLRVYVAGFSRTKPNQINISSSMFASCVRMLRTRRQANMTEPSS